MRVKVSFTSGNTIVCEDPFVIVDKSKLCPSLFEKEDIVIFAENIESIMVEER